MCLSARCLGRQCLTVCLVSTLMAAGAHTQIRAEVERATATAYDIGDPAVAAYKLDIDLRLTNQSIQAVELPVLNRKSRAATRFALMGAGVKGPDGSWASLFDASWYDVGTTKYDACTSISPDKEAAYRNEKSELILMKKQLAAVSDESTIRLTLMALCRGADGKVRTTTLNSDGFKLHLTGRPIAQPGIIWKAPQ